MQAELPNLIIILLKLSFIPVSYSSLRKVLWVDGTGGYTTGTGGYTNIAIIVTSSRVQVRL